MVKIEILPQEVNAFDALLKDAKCPPEMGYLLTSLKFKMFKAFEAEKTKEAKEVVKRMLDDEKKEKKLPKDPPIETVDSAMKKVKK